MSDLTHNPERLAVSVAASRSRLQHDEAMLTASCARGSLEALEGAWQSDRQRTLAELRGVRDFTPEQWKRLSDPSLLGQVVPMELLENARETLLRVGMDEVVRRHPCTQSRLAGSE